MVQKKIENEYEQLKRQNRRRLVGAVVMVVAAGGILASTGSFGAKSAADEEGKLALAASGDKQAANANSAHSNTTVLPKVTVHNQQDNTVQTVETAADKQQAQWLKQQQAAQQAEEKRLQEQAAAEQARKKPQADESQARSAQAGSNEGTTEISEQQAAKQRQQELDFLAKERAEKDSLSSTTAVATAPPYLGP